MSEMRNTVTLTVDPIDQINIRDLVSDDRAGAISSFIGTTRSHFHGKKVLQLEYEAYESMVHHTIGLIIDEARSKWQVYHIAVIHRLGIVPVGLASVAIAVSSEHRSEAINAVQYCIDELKARVPIWKKEVYEDGSVWKQNAEFDGARKSCCSR
jgi:molybdopterin synthase catalytic subunit